MKFGLLTRKEQGFLLFLLALYRWWTDKDLDEHKSHLGVKTPDADRGMQLPMSDFRKGIQVLLPDVGYAASAAIEDRCFDAELNRASWRKLSFLSVEEWAALEITDRKGKPRRLGESRAKRIVEALR